MYRLPFIALFMMILVQSSAQSPHGEQLQMNCVACHNTSGWDIPQEHWDFQKFKEKKISKTTGMELPDLDSSFNHFNTEFPLLGTHAEIDCRSCHETLVFDEVKTQCIDCHLDVHSMTAGNDCVRCHNSTSWLVDEIPEIHEQNGFPLVGVHGGLSCVDCHQSDTNLRFGRIGNDCVSCHQDDYDMTTSPVHSDAGFSTNCLDCHSPETGSWDTEIVDHSFFPLTLGHDIEDCKACHVTENFNDASPDCISCHQEDFEATLNPDHEILHFDNDCAICHTTNPGWIPAIFSDHDAAFFPIYSGEHEGEWNDCVDCHTNPNNYAEFTCIGCHTNPETDNEHDEVPGYVYEDNACLACHPTGDSDGAFNHDDTNFPLTGAHIGVECLECHSNGFAGTPTDCASCHTMDFDNSLNPNHTELNLPNDCAACHTTDPEWMPATFDIHDDFYPLEGAHALIANDCATCHNGDYNNTPNTCVGCHQENYDATTNPNHVNANFSTDCATCHTQDAWEPATFDHDAQYFPIYSGAHEGEWSECLDCHINPNNFAEFTCVACHENPVTDNQHDEVPGYIYEDNACLACHPTGESEGAFNHDDTNFPLTGAHIGVECLECHANGFEGTPTDCLACHEMDFNGSINPSHTELTLPTDCASCHTTEPDWMPATFAIHDDFYPLEGAHALIANDCASCHNGDYNNTPNTCVGCHQENYDGTTNPNHVNANFSTDCATCHTQDAWEPATFDHDAQYFPIYSGAHEGEWSECLDCHINPNNFAEFTCIGCHTNPETDNQHDAVAGYIYEDNACLACHPTGDAGTAFNHDATNFPLTGSHLGIACLDCHSNGFEGTPTDCLACHEMDFNGSINPSHTELNLPTDCASCHTTEPDWMPATFAIHDDFYPLEGAHALIANDCASCHNGEYNNTPNTCVGCHQENYDGTTNPNHVNANFSTDCVTCHTQDAWEPATFDHDAQYFPIYSGAHEGEWSECLDCHINPNNFAEFTCIACHLNPETDNQHDAVAGYIYEDNACLACHPTGDAGTAFNHDATNFPLTGSHLGIACLDCHSNGFEGTPTDCLACHEMDFNGSINPSHTELNLPTDCASCHTTEPDWMPATFAIHDDFYPLEGAHALIANDCASCHNGDYNNTPNTCVGCHQENYDATTNPNHVGANFSTDCATCHTQDAWEPATFDHDAQYFPIYSGAHEGEWSECLDCHINPNNFAEFTCIGCHANPETDNQHDAVAGYIYEDNACLACHPTGDAGTAFNHDATNFPLTGSHLGIACLDCHSNGFEGTPTDCLACHEMDFNGSINPSHTELNLPTDCASCHTTEPDWMPATFAIHDDFYPLEGAHALIANDCASCHNGDYNNTPNTCIGCHLEDFNAALDPNHAANNFSTDCLNCHTQETWTPTTFDHAATDFPLIDSHAGLACLDCHSDGYEGTSTDCFACHEMDFNNSINPNHTELNLSNDCASCHTAAPDWMPASFAIHDDFYPLEGAHALIANDCATCHNGDYNNTPNTCVGCHLENYNSTTNPNHQAANFSTDCATCHTQDAWEPATFDHDAQYFPIYSGAHEGEWSECIDCHIDPNNFAEFTCIGCHINPETDDQHDQVSGYVYEDNACLACHPTGDAGTAFNHDATNFPLTGSHIGIDCIDCHINGYAGTPTDCASCHQMDFDNSINPNHPQLGIPNDCASCHTTDADWMPATFDIHDNYYVLEGAHVAIANDCATCHNGDYNNTPNTCIGCHQTDFDGTTDPNHATNNFSTECLDCHTQDAWTPSTFDHAATAFPLTGSHIGVACLDCHSNGYAGTPTDCASCHQMDFDNSINPNHPQLGIPNDCASCHTTDADWMPATFDIHDNYYVLEGAHVAIANDCATCHNGDYNNTPNTCIGCHQADFDGTTDPNHATNNFSTECLDCHTQDAWSPSTFDHAATNFPLTGSHIGVACLDCHSNGYAGTPTDCASCHQMDFDNSINPNHPQLGIPNDCATCHTTDADWMPATFDIHDNYYVLEGAHVAIANDCAACHNGDYNNTPNTCIGCHQVDYDGTTDPNHAANNFSTECLDCHTQDAWTPSTFDHAATAFPLTGSHIGVACLDCHSNGYAGTPTDCAACHDLDFNGAVNPNHVALSLPNDCASCHTTDPDWMPATFDIHDNYYVLEGAHVAIANDCAVCHNGDYNNTPNTCFGCHQTDYVATVNPNHSANNFSTECLDCHSQEVWVPSTYDHTIIYPLNGAHAIIENECLQCHANGYNNTPNTCVGCHLTDYNSTTNPDHAAAMFSTQCLDCHTEVSWIPSTFDHNFYPLNGAHAVIANDCIQCHANGYTNTPNTCIGCHQADYNNTNNPNHSAAQFPTDCLNCHSENAFDI